MSLSSPSASRDSSDGPYSPNSMQTRPSIEYPDRMMQSARSQPSARGPAQTSGLNWGQLQAERGNTLGRGVDPAPFQGRTSRPSSSQRVTRAPLLSYQTTSDSSSMSSLSAVSNADTAVSSLPYSVEEGNKNVSDRSSMSLPPISAVGLPPFSGSSLYPDPSKCDIQDPSANWTASPYYASQTPQARLNPSSSAGMSFESLQLARLHNMSFGQLRLTHPAHEETLANTFDLAQDLPQERHSLRSLTLQHEHGGATSTSRPCLPKPRLPPHQISLPKLPSMSSPDRDKQECAPANKNALHVLALAGNMVERRQSPPPP
ncbi:hypothetical protein MMC21_004610 [Puttea exsequens]|nr:hypothetical protein [Puttea exsequens]